MGARYQGAGMGPVLIGIIQRGRVNETHSGKGSRGEVTVPVASVLIPYTGVDTSGKNEISMAGVGGAGPVVVIRGRER